MLNLKNLYKSNFNILDIHHNIIYAQIEEKENKIAKKLLKIQEIQNNENLNENEKKNQNYKFTETQNNFFDCDSLQDFIMKTSFIIKDFIEIENKNDIESINEKQRLKKKYLEILNIKNIKDPDEILDKCKTCKNSRIIVTGANLCCDTCGLVVVTNFDCDKNVTYDQLSQYSFSKKQIYKKKNHFMEIWLQKQGLQKTTVPPDVISAIKEQLRRRKRQDYNNLNPYDIENYLKKTGFTQYKDRIYTILEMLKEGSQNLTIETSITKEVELMFDKYESTFDKVKGNGRKSSISYNYVIRKILEILGYQQYKIRFDLPKDGNRVLEYDEIWKKICKNNQWKFIPS
jgi:hypothetical protein